MLALDPFQQGREIRTHIVKGSQPAWRHTRLLQLVQRPRRGARKAGHAGHGREIRQAAVFHLEGDSCCHRLGAQTAGWTQSGFRERRQCEAGDELDETGPGDAEEAAEFGGDARGQFVGGGAARSDDEQLGGQQLADVIASRCEACGGRRRGEQARPSHEAVYRGDSVGTAWEDSDSGDNGT